MTNVDNNSSSTKNLAMSLIVLVIIVSIITLAFSGTFERVYELAQQKLGLKSDQLTYVTYYQWTDSKGNMKISRQVPVGQEYITFRADKKLQETKYKLDSELIEKGKQFRHEFLADKEKARQFQQQTMALKKKDLDKIKNINCNEIKENILSIESKLESKMSASDLTYYQEKLRAARWQRISNEC